MITPNLLFRIVENIQFRRLINILRPNAIILSPSTIHHAVHNYAQNIISELKDIIPQNVQVYIMTDTWTSPNRLAFARTTVHFLDSHWNLH
ncbi:hypothetical protein EV426DRAFT_541764 [Tirmania nivea]|nr:hypothetical protein EV426DRAFT_541764 [Tirmania nivea]